MAIAPATFRSVRRRASECGNFGDGKINAFNVTTGTTLLGTLNDAKGNPIVEQGLWSLNFGGAAKNADSGTLYFTAGPGGGPNNDPVESHGLFGSIQAVPSFQTAGVMSGASFLQLDPLRRMHGRRSKATGSPPPRVAGRLPVTRFPHRRMVLA